MGSGDLGDGVAENGTTALLAAEHALLVDGDPWTARGLFAAAYDEAEHSDDPDTLARAALGLGGIWAQEQRTVADAAATRTRQRAALRRLAPRSVLALRLRIRLTAERAYRTGEPGPILAQVAEARTAGDRVAKVEALTLAHYCAMGPGHGPLRLELAQELIGEASRTGRPGDLLVGLLLHTVDLFLDAHPHAARSLAELREHLAIHEHRAVRAMVEVIEVMLGVRAGRLAAAGAAADAWAERGATAAGVNARAWYGGQLGTIRWFQGRIAELRPMLSDLVDSPTLSETDYSTYASLALAAASAGDRPLATSMLARLRGRGLAALPQAATWLLTMYCVTETAWLLNDTGAAAEAAALLAPYARLPVIAGHGITCLGSVHHCLGMAALTTCDTSAAVRHLRAAVQDNMTLGHRPATALSRARLAHALALPGRSQDLAAADAELIAAAEEAAELHMPPPGIERGTARLRDGDAGAPGRGTPAMCRRRGTRWDVELGGRATTVDHCLGLEYLAVLMANPGQEIPAADLAAGHGGQDAARPATTGQPLLDEAAKRQYRQRLADLQDQADRSEMAGDPDRAADLQRERDWLIAELASATGLGGRARRFADNDERARIAVGKAIRRALDRITDADPLIGAELRSHVRTGLRCCYLGSRAEHRQRAAPSP
ncbi:hypothetical protein [Actinomadura opuntiae]|uniref:hypothetical protein n=1 Tax=Actinomadura sp. OS1-43 TaxID=604315 RepID=UPI00255A80BE|nr:hypothetical protein [Actinomadura sp. OS1-43]MDL4814038.1 hypothetical protein [Actinomadura sp. OS1-43]